MEVDKKNVLDLLYILKISLMEKSKDRHDKSISLENLSDKKYNEGMGEAYERAWCALDETIIDIMNL